MTTIVWAGVAYFDASMPPDPNYGVVVEGQRISDLGPLDELRARYPAADEVGGSELILLPAFVNSHDHGRGLGTAPLGVPDDLLESWLIGLRAQPALDRYLAAVFDGVRLLRSGVCATIHSHNPLDRYHLGKESEDTLRGYRDAGIRVAYGPPIVDQNPLVYDDESGFLDRLAPEVRALATPMTRPGYVDSDDYFGVCADLLSRFQDTDSFTVQIQSNPVAAQWSSDAVLARSAEFARKHETRMQLHLLETIYQRDYGHRRYGKSIVRHLDDLGVLGPWLTVAHAVWVDPDDVSLLVERGVGVAHNPSSNLRLRSGVAPVAAMLRAGVSVGVGLDGHALDADQDYPRELRLAWTLANRPGAASLNVSASEVWGMGTRVGAAITFGPWAPLGVVKRGGLADIVLFDRGEGIEDWTIGLSAQPKVADENANLSELMLRCVSHRNVRHVMVNGTWVIRDRHSTRVDETEIVAALRANLASQRGADRRASRDVAREIAPAIRSFYAGWSDVEAEPR